MGGIPKAGSLLKSTDGRVHGSRGTLVVPLNLRPPCIGQFIPGGVSPARLLLADYLLAPIDAQSTPSFRIC